jgi:uncharacterized protein (TIGR00725 family)
MKKLIGVFGPGTSQPASDLYRLAEQLGASLAAAGFVVVTGGYAGIMEAAMKGAKSGNGQTVGVTAEVYFARGREPNAFVGREIRVKSAVDRLMELIDLPDAYVAVGNSPGTTIEVVTAWDYMVKRFIPRKPILLLGKTWESFTEYLQGEAEFQEHLSLLECHSSSDSVVERLEAIFGKQLLLPELTILQE